MGMFSNLMGKIFAHASAPVTQPAATATNAPIPAPSSTPGVVAPSPGTTTTYSSPVVPAASASSTPAVAPQTVDVSAILNGLAERNAEHLDWKKSIVDMLKLLDMDSSLSARKELATDLHYTGDESDSGTMNVWLHKEVLKKLAENGGKVPAELIS